MDKQEYLNLSVEDRVQYVNTLLADGKSVNAIGQNLGMAESNIRQQFNKAGYFRVDRGGPFVLTDKPEGTESAKVAPSESVTQRVAQNEQPITEKQIAQNEPIVSTAEKPAQEKELAPNINPDDFNALVGRVEALEQTLKESLDQAARAAESRHIIIDLPEETQEIRNTFRLNGTVFQKWQDLQKRCPGVTAKDLMSQALWDYINHHDVE